MVTQLRIDACRVVQEKLVLEYTHAAFDPLTPQPSGMGCAWETTEAMFEHARALRDWLGEPEQLVLLHLLQAFDVDIPPDSTKTDTALAMLPGKVATLDKGIVTIG